MGLLSKPKSYIGIDLGTSSIKMVELQDKNGKAMLSTYGYVEQSTDIVRASSSDMETKIVNIIKAIHKDSRMTSDQVIAALPSFSVFSSIIHLPSMNKKDIAQAVKWEAKKFVPLPIEDMTLDWKVIEDKKSNNSQTSSHLHFFGEGKKNKGDKSNEKEQSNPIDPNAPLSSTDKNKGKEEDDKDKKNTQKIFSNKKKGGDEKDMKILLTAAPRSLVERYINIFKSAELELVSLETEAFALDRSLVGGDTSSVMIIDIGAVSTDIAVVSNNVPVLTRSIDVGGSSITKAVMSNLNVDLDRAEQFKRDIGFSSAGPGELPEIIKSAISPIINEVKYSLDIYTTKSDNTVNPPLEKIILTGGSSYLIELVDYLGKILDMKVIIGDPWDRVMYPLELRPALNEIGPRFSVAVGLAMREI